MTDEDKALLKKHGARELEAGKRIAAQLDQLLELEYWDTAISRSYYAIFHAARGILQIRGCAPATHRGVVSEFARVLIKTGELDREFQKILQDVREERQAADYESYELELLPGPDLARTTVAKAKKFVAKIEKIAREAQ